MELNLERPLLFFDIESTGLNIATDGIIELCFVKVFPGGEKQVKTWRIKPWDYDKHCQIPIHPSASAVNGVKDEDLIDCKRFIEYAEEIAQWLKDSDLSGFNSSKFDLPMLAEEIERVLSYCNRRINDPNVPSEKKQKAQEMINNLDINLHERKMIDIQTIYHYMEPRNLRAAYRFYCGGQDFENAHTAEADTIATYEVLKGQLEMYQQPDSFHNQALQNNVEFLSNLGGRPKTVDYAGRIILKDGVPTVSFGKHKDMPVKEVLIKDRNYFKWIEDGEFTLDTKRQFRDLRLKYEAEIKEESSKILDNDEMDAAKDLLRAHFGGL